MIHIDGSFGEGGGQILRTSLALSLVTGAPFSIEKIRANRKKPGLRQQHLTAVNAAAEISGADVRGNSPGSMYLSFAPDVVRARSCRFDVGTAGSCTLVLQTILPALMAAENSSEISLQGGTHNPLAPPFDFLDRSFLPILRRMGGKVSATLERPGFYPAGGGRFRVQVEPGSQLSCLELLERGTIQRKSGRAILSNLPQHIGERELKVVRDMLDWEHRNLSLETVKEPLGPGNVLVLTLECDHITEVFTGFGERGVRAETVAKRAVNELREYLDAGVPVGRHLADQLIIPMALAGGGIFRTLSPTQHTVTNIEVVKRFLPVNITMRQLTENVWDINIS